MSETRFLRNLEALVRRMFPRERFLGPRKYRLVRMRPSVASGDLTRAELQIVAKSTGMPDLLFVDIWPGMAGAWAKLQPGTLVLVEFVDGDPGQPVVRSFATADDPAWKPIDVTIDATGTMKLGPSAARVDVADGTDTIATPGDEAGRAVKYGDIIMFPVSAGAVLTAMPILGSAPGATGAPMVPFDASKVRV